MNHPPYLQARPGLWLLLLALYLGASACVSKEREFDWNSGNDHLRKDARKLFIGQRVTDRISDPEGDHTDWKTIRVREPGTMGVTISIDDTRGMKGFISLKDGFGVELERRPVVNSTTLYVFDRIPVYQGEYYLQIFADRGQSVYTVGVTFTPLPDGAVPPPRNGDNAGGGVVSSGGNTGGGGGFKRPDETGEPEGGEPDKDPDTTTPETSDEEFTSLRGRIVRFVPLDDGGTQITISGFGSRDGVAAGMSGTIVGLGAAFRVVKALPQSAVAVTSAEAEQLGPYKGVVLRVKKK